MLTEAFPDMMRSLLRTMLNALLSLDAVTGAEYSQPCRVAWRNVPLPYPGYPRRHHRPGHP